MMKIKGTIAGATTDAMRDDGRAGRAMRDWREGVHMGSLVHSREREVILESARWAGNDTDVWPSGLDE
ncbi:hypothetical protein [Roseateles chitinivorans]|uniref:hypothetical protein n=1 Tax=Roseateles chitinivorans TaxID=2917965 RepID=UPI003D66A5D1